MPALPSHILHTYTPTHIQHTFSLSTQKKQVEMDTMLANRLAKACLAVNHLDDPMKYIVYILRPRIKGTHVVVYIDENGIVECVADHKFSERNIGGNIEGRVGGMCANLQAAINKSPDKAKYKNCVITGVVENKWPNFLYVQYVFDHAHSSYWFYNSHLKEFFQDIIYAVSFFPEHGGEFTYELAGHPNCADENTKTLSRMAKVLETIGCTKWSSNHTVSGTMFDYDSVDVIACTWCPSHFKALTFNIELEEQSVTSNLQPDQGTTPACNDPVKHA